jgi:Protein of unknown function (DUF3574)
MGKASGTKARSNCLLIGNAPRSAAMQREPVAGERPPYRLILACCGLIGVGVLAAASAAAQGFTCGPPRKPMQEVELMFGRNIGGRLGVGEAAWSRFLAREVTPRFPDGLSVIDASGQWRDPVRGRVTREPSKLVIIVMPDDAGMQDRITAITTAYKQHFRQQSVGVVTRPVCAAF